MNPYKLHFNIKSIKHRGGVITNEARIKWRVSIFLEARIHPFNSLANPSKKISHIGRCAKTFKNECIYHNYSPFGACFNLIT